MYPKANLVHYIKGVKSVMYGKMLWIDSNPKFFYWIAKNFINYSRGVQFIMENEYLKIGEHCGYGYMPPRISPDSEIEIRDLSRPSDISIAEDFNFHDKSQINQLASNIARNYNVVALNIALTQDEGQCWMYNKLSPTEGLSMKLCHELLTKNICVVLLSRFLLDTRMDDHWREAYAFFHPDDGVCDRFIYSTEAMAYEFRLYRAKHFIKEVKDRLAAQGHC
jgi:hypothetical protein